MWGGYVLFGLPYFVVATGFFGYTLESRLASTKVLSMIHGQMFHPRLENYRPSVMVEDGDIVSNPSQQSDGSISNLVVRPQNAQFAAVGNALFCIPFGLLGSMIARAFHRRRNVTAESP